MQVRFNNQGNFFKKFKLKLVNIFWNIVISILILFAGLYTLFFKFHTVISVSDKILGYSLIIIGLILLIVLPIYTLLKPINKSMKGIVTINIEKDNNDYLISIFANNYDFKGKINLINIRKNFIEILVIGSNTIYIPINEITEEEKNNLIDLEKEIRKLRTKK